MWMQAVWIRWLQKLIRCISNYYFQCFTTIHSVVHETFCWLTNTHMQAQFLGHMPFIIIDHLLNWEYSFFASFIFLLTIFLQKLLHLATGSGVSQCEHKGVHHYKIHGYTVCFNSSSFCFVLFFKHFIVWVISYAFDSW